MEELPLDKFSNNHEIAYAYNSNSNNKFIIKEISH